ncbi:AraC family transcriptional regulator [Arthrobacter tumbae]|uniref:helix-turn-helix domain-containing protein n=1 Tax=Arthrobacter tumbae TaxID=163874 RepID=UPI00195D242F|nr:AraC family transcriptional regulator [Arthrobacter tumbae]MBM7781901.1 AraC-like DNA-binding protein/mannose-6-phosphate isomerase-like protein (cupin superfamily) [Arthrobacter tumbae]
MRISHRDEDAAVRLAERLTGLRANREVIPHNPDQSVRWHQHDYPTAIARWNYHPEYEVHLIREGSGRFIVGDHLGTFEAGQVTLIGSGLPHDWVSDLKPGEVIRNRDAVLQFDGQWLRNCAGLMPELVEVEPVLEESARGILFTGETATKAAEAIEAVGKSVGIEQLHHVLRVLAIFSRSPQTDRVLLAREWFQPQLDGEAAAVVDIALEYIFANHSGPVRMSEAASLVGMAEPTFSKYFRRATGQNFSDMVRKLRLAHACRLLEQTQTPISEVCFEVGFSNLSNFNRHFLAETGLNPRRYRFERTKQ